MVDARGSLISARRVVLGAGDQLEIAPAALRIEGSRIVEVRRVAAGTYREEVGRWAEEARSTVRDFGDRLLTPAFVNAHTHLALGFLRGSTPPQALRGNMVREFYFGIEQNLTPEDVAAFTRMGAYESLLAGVGLVWDHYYHAEAVAEAMAATGLAGVVAPTLQDLSGPGVQWRAEQLRATETIARSTELAARGIVAAVGPHATDTVSEGLWREACDLARSLHLPLHAHLAQSLEEHSFSIAERGAPPARWLAELGVLGGVPATAFAHAIYVSRAELELLEADRDLMVYCPCSQQVFGFPADPMVWEEAGLRWAVATDCSPSNDSMNVQKELRQVAGLRTVGTTWSREYRDFLEPRSDQVGAAASRDPGARDAAARDAWRERTRLYQRAEAATRPAALLARVWSVPGSLHPAVRAGVLEAGALASVLVWDSDHPSMWPEPGLSTLVMGDTTPAIHAMFVAGREIGEAGDFHRSVAESDHYPRTVAEATRRRRSLLARCA